MAGMTHNEGFVEQQGPNHIVRIRQDSNLDELFKVAIEGAAKGGQIPMRMRNLPPSFFQQPDGALKGGIVHSRAHSSPASLEQTYRSAQQQPQHTRQQSYDLVDEDPLPAGWEMARTSTGQRYFLNHQTHTTTWEDPRKKLNGQMSASHHATAPPPPHTTNPSTVINAKTLGTLPDGWEQATTPEGEVYFINHVERTTSWFDPRIPMHLQKAAIIARQQQQGVQMLDGQVQSPLGSSHNLKDSGSTDSINAVCAATSSLSIQQQQQMARLQQLEMEREKMKLRQQEILRQPAFGLTNETNNNTMTSHLSASNSLGLTDPFLGGPHSRQESADSGLGLGPNFSLPPEEFLSSIDSNPGVDDTSMDTMVSGAPSQPEQMDSDDLVPSLNEINADLLPDMEALLGANKDSVLTWL